MTDLVIRLIELTLGFMLILTSLFLSNYSTSQFVLLLPLLTLPIVFSGMFGWHPIKALGAKFSMIVANHGDLLRRLSGAKTTASVH